MAALAGKISLAFCLLGALEIDLVLLLDLQGIAAVRMVLLRVLLLRIPSDSFFPSDSA